MKFVAQAGGVKKDDMSLSEQTLMDVARVVKGKKCNLAKMLEKVMAIKLTTIKEKGQNCTHAHSSRENCTIGLGTQTRAKRGSCVERTLKKGKALKVQKEVNFSQSQQHQDLHPGAK